MIDPANSPPANSPAGGPAAALSGFTRFVGLDVHKKTVMACVLDSAGQTLHGEEFACTAAGLGGFARRWLGEDSAVALEATSNTWAVCGILAGLCGKVKVSNPLKTRAIAQASVKTDKVDARVLAQLLRCDYLPGVWMPDEPTRRLRQQVARRTALVQDRTAVKNRIHSILAAQLLAVPMAKLYDAAGLAWLKQVAMDPQSRRFVDSDLRLLETLDKEIAMMDQELAVAAQQDDQARLLMTLPGVDYPVAMTLLGALGDISRFKDGDHAASYLGLTPRVKQSAQHCYLGSITKQGNSHARWMLVEAAQHLDKHPGPLGVFFRRLAKKKNRNVAVVATARKLVTIGFLMLKSNEPYRYAQPATIAAKLSRLRLKAGGNKRRGGIPKGSGRHAHYGSGQNRRRIPGLAEACQNEGLPKPQAPEQLPPGEKRMLAETCTLPIVESFHRESFRVRGGSTPKARDLARTNVPTAVTAAAAVTAAVATAAAFSGAGHPAPSPAPEPPPLPLSHPRGAGGQAGVNKIRRHEKKPAPRLI